MGSIAKIPFDIMGGKQQADADRQQGWAQYQLAQQNAGVANAQAVDALTRGAFQAGLARMKGTQLAGQQTVGYAASGVDAGSGSAATTLADTGAMSELNAGILKNNAAREAWGYKVKALNESEQGELDLRAADNNAKATLLTSYGNAMGDFASGAESLMKLGS